MNNNGILCKCVVCNATHDIFMCNKVHYFKVNPFVNPLYIPYLNIAFFSGNIFNSIYKNYILTSKLWCFGLLLKCIKTEFSWHFCNLCKTYLSLEASSISLLEDDSVCPRCHTLSILRRWRIQKWRIIKCG